MSGYLWATARPSVINTCYYQLAKVNNETVVYSHSIRVPMNEQGTHPIRKFPLGECPYAGVPPLNP